MKSVVLALIGWAMFFSIPAMACQTLTTTQLCTLRTDMGTHTELATAITNLDLATITTFYNADTSPAVVAWRSEIGPDVVVEEVDWAEYVAISAQKHNAFSVLQSFGSLRVGLENVRTGLTEIFTVAESPNTRAALIAVAKRTMTVCENVFKLGSGPTYDLGVDGPIDNSTVLWALTNCQ